MKKNVVALMYDFDETLSSGYMQNYSLIPLLKYDVGQFWEEVNTFGKENNMDGILAYLFKIIEIANKNNIDISKVKLRELGAPIIFFPGVEDWFERITEFGKSIGLQIEHYIISSGMKEIIEGTKISKYFKEIFACSYCYNEKNEPYWPCQAVNYTNKTQYIFRIRKNEILDLNSSAGVNDYLTEKNKLPYSHMLYFGDGLTDIPCMKLIKTKGGHSFCVYDPNSLKAKETAIKIFKDKRVDYIAKASYNEGSDIDTMVKSVLIGISEKLKVENLLKKTY